MNEFIDQFLLESRELVEQATSDLLALERFPDDGERLDSAFRAFHTLKGGAGIVEFDAMGSVVHAAENILASVRAGARAVTPALVSDCLACLDQVGRWLDEIEARGEIPATAPADALAMVARLNPSSDTGPDPAASTPLLPGAKPGKWVDVLLAYHPDVRALATTALRYAPDADCFFRSDDPLARMAALPGLLCLELAPAAPWPALDALDPFACNLVMTALTQGSVTEATTALGDAIAQCEIHSLVTLPKAEAVDARSRRAQQLLEAQLALLAERTGPGTAGRIAAAGRVAENVLRHLGRTGEADALLRATQLGVTGLDAKVLRLAIEAALMEREAAPAASSPRDDREERQIRSTHTLRVDARRIDALANLTGEVIVAKNAIGHVWKLARVGDSALAAMLKDRHAILERLVSELQKSVTGMRVLPLRNVFQRLPRLVREMALDLGKPANLLIEGDETEADKVIVEMLFEPLLHVLRNAMDHGVETASERESIGKPATATIRVRATSQGEHVVVEIQDDGQGIDIPRVRKIALERGLIPAEILDAMSDQDAMDLIFAPGFSTAARVTDLSGRGVGLDAVRSAVERLGGRVGVDSRRGDGTTIRFTLPFSVLMTRIMTVEAGGQMFGVALDAVVETVRVGVDRLFPVGAARAIVLRERTIPVIDLGLHWESRLNKAAAPRPRSSSPKSKDNWAACVSTASGSAWK